MNQGTQETKKPPSPSSREQEPENTSLKNTYNQNKDFKYHRNISPPRHQDSRIKNLATECLNNSFLPSFQKEPGNSNTTEYKQTEWKQLGGCSVCEAHIVGYVGYVCFFEFGNF